MNYFSALIKERRSANNFIEEVPIDRKELNDIFEEVKLAPSAFNLQHTHYVVIQDKEIKAKMQEAAFGQYKVHSASAVILVTGDKKAYEKAGSIYEGLKMLGILNECQYDSMVKETVETYLTRGPVFQRDEAIRNASLSAMLFMLAAKNKGWDTCPMIGFDANKAKEILQLQENVEPVMMIAIGKEKKESRHPRGYRKPISEFVQYF
ncbi:nitroreductase family protein [Niallia sp. NCCP-28]|uniref:nitroreductase family protein n=1 Tax=Niallia sp. NCCP-28 TaxID=2934712 RepID=UPI0020800277|nr:nitroreductase family protein [Niallia sp. NCCP-28]GKU83061.1 putative NAD(P)H nitroreductase MhqN [Niallia sp. NCCP-28]